MCINSQQIISCFPANKRPKDNTAIITVATVVSLLAILLAVGSVWCFWLDVSCLSVCECCNMCVLLINKISLVSRPTKVPKDNTAIITVATVASLFTTMMAVRFVWCFSLLDFPYLSLCECCNMCVSLVNRIFLVSRPTNDPKDNIAIITVATVVSLLAILLAVGFCMVFPLRFLLFVSL